MTDHQKAEAEAVEQARYHNIANATAIIKEKLHTIAAVLETRDDENEQKRKDDLAQTTRECTADEAFYTGLEDYVPKLPTALKEHFRSTLDESAGPTLGVINSPTARRLQTVIHMDEYLNQWVALRPILAEQPAANGEWEAEKKFKGKSFIGQVDLKGGSKGSKGNKAGGDAGGGGSAVVLPPSDDIITAATHATENDDDAITEEWNLLTEAAATSYELRADLGARLGNVVGKMAPERSELIESRTPGAIADFVARTERLTEADEYPVGQYSFLDGDGARTELGPTTAVPEELQGRESYDKLEAWAESGQEGLPPAAAAGTSPSPAAILPEKEPALVAMQSSDDGGGGDTDAEGEGRTGGVLSEHSKNAEEDAGDAKGCVCTRCRQDKLDDFKAKYETKLDTCTVATLKGACRQAGLKGPMGTKKYEIVQRLVSFTFDPRDAGESKVHSCALIYTHTLTHVYTHTLIHSYAHTLIHSHAHTLIRSYAHTLIRSYAHTLIHSYTHTLIRPYAHTLIHSYTHTLIHSHAHTLIRSYTHTLIHSYAHTLIRSYTHTLIHSYTHALIRSYTQNGQWVPHVGAVVMANYHGVGDWYEGKVVEVHLLSHTVTLRYIFNHMERVAFGTTQCSHHIRINSECDCMD
jgi:hypothetical protein